MMKNQVLTKTKWYKMVTGIGLLPLNSINKIVCLKIVIAIA